jgi:hypothetical protein
MTSKTLTLKRGQETRRFVVDNDPAVTVGSEVRLRGGNGEIWTVAKIEDSEIITRFLLPNPPMTTHERTTRPDPQPAAIQPKE